jgi:hypothetical protein
MEDKKGNNIFLDDDDNEVNLEQLKKYMEKYKISDRAIYEEELPTNRFDLTVSLSNDLKEFGVSKQFDKIGWAVKYIGDVKITDKDGNIIDMSGKLGYVVSESNDRVVIHTNDGYFGWVNPNEYEIINLVHNKSTKLN